MAGDDANPAATAPASAAAGGSSPALGSKHGGQQSAAPPPAHAPAGPSPASLRSVMVNFHQATMAARAKELRLSPLRTVLARVRPPAKSTASSITTSDLRSPAASRKMMSLLNALPSERYEDVQLLVERCYQLYRFEYERAWKALALAEEDPGPSSSKHPASPEFSATDEQLLHGFLATVLDWAPINRLRGDLLIDEDEDERLRSSNAAYGAQQRIIIEQLKGKRPIDRVPECEGGVGTEAQRPSEPLPAPSFEEKGRLLRTRCLAFQQQLDLAFGDIDASGTEEAADEILNAVVHISDQAFVLTLDASAKLRFNAKFLHILAKRCIFLLETAYRLRVVVHYAKPPYPSFSNNITLRLGAARCIYKFVEGAGVFKTSSGIPDLLTDASRTRGSRSYELLRHELVLESSRPDPARIGVEAEYNLDRNHFNAALRRNLKDSGSFSAMEKEFGKYSDAVTRSGRERAATPQRSGATRRPDRPAPLDVRAHANLWDALQRAQPAMMAANQAPPDPVDARQIFQRRPRENFSLRQFFLSFVPGSIQTAFYHAFVPAPVRILIGSAEARQLLPQLMMHTTWLLFKIFIFVSILTARLGISIPTAPQQPRAQRSGAASAAGAAANGPAQNAQAQGQAQAGGGIFKLETLFKLTTLTGFLKLLDDVCAALGIPALSLYWKFYGLCLAALAFTFWDMERWLNRRLERIRREQRRNNRANAADGRAPPPPARNVAGAVAQALPAPGGHAAGPPAAAPLAGERNGTDTPDEAATPGLPDLPPAPPAHASPVYAPRRVTVFARQRRDPGQQLGIVVAASLGPAPLLAYLLERLAYFGLDREDEELGLIPRSRVPAGAIVDDATGLIRSVYRPASRTHSTRAAQRLQAPPRQVTVLYEDIENEHPTAIHRAGRIPLSIIARRLAASGQTGWEVTQTLAVEVVYRILLAFALMLISVIPECEILRRKAIDRRTELWRNARRREIERRAKVAEYEAEKQRRLEAAAAKQVDGPDIDQNAADGHDGNSTLRRRNPTSGAPTQQDAA